MTSLRSRGGALLIENNALAIDDRCCDCFSNCAAENGVLANWSLAEFQYDISDLSAWDTFTEGHPGWQLVVVWHNFNVLQDVNTWALRTAYWYWINCDTTADAFTFEEAVRLFGNGLFGASNEVFIGNTVYVSDQELLTFAVGTRPEVDTESIPGSQEFIRQQSIEVCPCDDEVTI